jgi:hypothetical protein
MTNILKRLREPPFGTETSERNLMVAAAGEIERLRRALEEIAKSSSMPDGFEWTGVDVGGFFYASYKSVGSDGKERTYSVDESNNGDIHDHGFEQGLHANAVAARAALTPDQL